MLITDALKQQHRNLIWCFKQINVNIRVNIDVNLLLLK